MSWYKVVINKTSDTAIDKKKIHTIFRAIIQYRKAHPLSPDAKAFRDLGVIDHHVYYFSPSAFQIAEEKIKQLATIVVECDELLDLTNLKEIPL
jgi:hypothetical protein